MKVLEFFSGIGGWRLALERAALDSNSDPIEVIEAFDINTSSNDVYYFNFNQKPKAVE